MALEKLKAMAKKSGIGGAKMLKAATKLGWRAKEAATLVSRPRTISVPDEALNAALSVGPVLARIGVDRLRVQAESRKITLVGQKDDANFRISVRPLRPVWTEECHELIFEVLDTDVRFEGSVMGMVKSTVVALLRFVGIDLVERKIKGKTGDDGYLHFPIEPDDERLKGLLACVELKEIRSEAGHIDLVVQGQLEGLIQFPEVLGGWLEHMAGKPGQ